MNKLCDYSAAYVVLSTSSPHNLQGHGLTFTIGRGNDLVCSAITYFASQLVGKSLNELTTDMGRTWKSLTSDPQLRWIGPEKGVIHLALGATINAVWDLWAKSENKPVWKLVADRTPQQIVDLVDFRYLTDAITPQEALQILQKANNNNNNSKEDRIRRVEQNIAVPTYTTSAGWLGYPDEKIKHLIQESLDAGYTHFKFKVGDSLVDDRRRLAMVREIIGYNDPKYVIMIDANQVWSVPEAITYMEGLAEFRPWFIEEPTSPDDILGHLAIKEALRKVNDVENEKKNENKTAGGDGEKDLERIKVATGEMCQNRIMFKQFITSGAIDIVQVDACRLGGLNEVIAVLLLACKYGLPVVPHSGGVGLPEYTQHISTIDYLVVSGKQSLLEYVDHLHQHFVDPAKVSNGHVVTPTLPGYSVEMKPEAWAEFEYPNGTFWSSHLANQLN